ncbi:MAG: hypothetical protein ABSF14_22105 [Terriglobia bacterium]|jgi:hypothetical protein
MALELIAPTRATAPRTKGVGAVSIEPNKYEIFVRRPDVIKFLRQLKVDNKDMKKQLVLTANKDDLSYTGTKMGGAGHGLNQVFAAGRFPFYARPTGIDKVRIGRISKEFSEKLYATKWSIENKFSSSGTDYEEPKKGQRERIREWISASGINLENPPVTLEEATHEVSRIPAEIAAKDEELYQSVRAEYLEELERLQAGDVSPDDEGSNGDDSAEKRLAELTQ